MQNFHRCTQINMIGILSIKTYFRYLGFVVFFQIFIPFQNISAQTAVLPFYTSGNSPIFSIQDAPVYLQESFHFFFEIKKEYPLQSLYSVNRAIQETGFRGEKKLNLSLAKQICSHTGAEYLLTGTADFSSNSSVVLTATTFICRSGQTLEARRQGSVKNIQSDIAELVISVSTYAKSKSNSPAVYNNNSINLSIILDMSGSMNSDFISIEKALRSAAGNLPEQSKIDAYLLREGRVDRMRDGGNSSVVLNRIFKERTGGRSSRNDLFSALTMIEKDYRWGGKNRLLIFTDVDFPEGRMNDIESRLRRLKGRGMEIYLFILSGQGYNEKNEWMRIARTMNLESPDVVYGRRVGFLEGYSRIILMNGNRFYSLDRDATSFILQNRVPDSSREIDMLQYSRDNFNLNDLPSLYARSEKLKIGGYGPVVSGLENKINHSLKSGTSSDKIYKRVLVKNRGMSFWIRVADDTVYRKMIQSGDKAFYAGLRFVPGNGLQTSPVNIPEFVYFKKQAEVPRMLVNEWAHFSRLSASKINSNDIWFFLVTVVRYDDGRESEDIRQ